MIKLRKGTVYCFNRWFSSHWWLGWICSVWCASPQTGAIFIHFLALLRLSFVCQCAASIFRGRYLADALVVPPCPLRREYVPSSHIIRPFCFLRLLDDSLYHKLSSIYLLFINYIHACYRLARVLPLQFDVLLRWPLIAFVSDLWVFGLLRLGPVDLFFIIPATFVVLMDFLL